MNTKKSASERAVPAAAGEEPTTKGVKGESDPHRGLRPVEQAARLTRADIVVLRVRMKLGRLLRGPPPTIVKAFAFTVPHIRLAVALWGQRRRKLILVREFLTALVILVWPIIWPLRKRVYFLVNHNVQEAYRRRPERWILHALCWTGFRLACFETAGGLTRLGLSRAADQVLILPHPIGRLVPPRVRTQSAHDPLVGVIGKTRSEKGTEDILAALLELREQGRLVARLLLGCPEAEVRALWRARGYEVVDTTARENYLASLDRCDVVVLNYRRERYYYRPSGVAADAITRRAAVVCPNFPLMRRQVTEPAKVGAVFEGTHQLGQAVREALTIATAADDPFRLHEEARGATAIAGLLDRFVVRIRG